MLFEGAFSWQRPVGARIQVLTVKISNVVASFVKERGTKTITIDATFKDTKAP